jgi:glycosyltransferase involved in cell wall biosynthesis
MQKPIRVLFISHDSGLYGAQLSLLGLLQKLDRNRFEPWVVANSEGPLVAAIRDLDIPVVIRPIVHWVASGSAIEQTWFSQVKSVLDGLRARVWAIAHLIEQNDIRIVYTNTVTCIEGALAARITHRLHVWHLREKVRANSQLRSIVPSYVLPWFINALSWRVLVNSQFLYRAYTYSPLRKKLSVVYNGVDPDKFSFNHEEASLLLRSELNIPSNHKIVATIGSVIPRKGQLLFADSASRLVLTTPDVTFIVVGDGSAEYMKLIQNNVKKLGLESNFHFLGCRKDIPKILAGVDLLVIAADEEPFGRTVIEAMAAGIPVVSTKCGGPEEIILDGVTGLLTPLKSPSAMAEAIKRILNNPDFSEALIKASKDRLFQKFTLQAYADNVQSQLESANYSYYLPDQ